MEAYIGQARRKYHASLMSGLLQKNAAGVWSNADKDNALSVTLAAGIATRLGEEVRGERLAAQSSGDKFETACAEFLRNTFPKFKHLRPGRWDVKRVSGRNRLEIARYEQYAHLAALDEAVSKNPDLAAILGNDYTITPDIIVTRDLENDKAINEPENLIDEQVTRLASLRESNGGLPLMHASISCKWTIRSDRAQNSRSEALNLVRNRKGHLPHVAVVTAEPLPSRLASIALGTGDIDCVYHFALYELQSAVSVSKNSEAKELLGIMVSGKRLKDVSDLPLDLAV